MLLETVCLFVVQKFHEAPTFKPALIAGSSVAICGRVAKETAPRNVAEPFATIYGWCGIVPEVRVAPVLLNESSLASWCGTLYRSWSFNESVLDELLRSSAVRRHLKAPSSYEMFHSAHR